MAARQQQDAFMEDSEDTCPLCVEEFDLFDKNFRPCPCGYQICQFCYNNIKNNMNGLCPACRRTYDDKNIEWKIFSPEEFKADVANSARRKAVARQKEVERKQVETLNRKHLQGLRVVQRNLVYITGMSTEGVSDDVLEDQLKANAVFGQYGKIIKLSANKLKDTGGGNAALAIFITFADEDSANRCIAALDGRVHQNRILKAQHGTTKYCSAFLRHEICNNRNCTFLHEAGEDRDSFSRQELSSLNAASSQARPQPSAITAAIRPPPPQATHSQTSNIAAAGSSQNRAEAMSRSDSGDGPALPSTANWAKNLQLQQSRRSSQAASRATPSPKAINAKLSSVGRPDSRTSSSRVAAVSAAPKERESGADQDADGTSSDQKKKEWPKSRQRSTKRTVSESYVQLRNECLRAVSEPINWTLDRTTLDEDTLRAVDTYAPMLESNGGLARQELRERQARHQRRHEEMSNAVRAMSPTKDEESRIGGSLQLGGEPDVGEDALESARHRIGPGLSFGHQGFDSAAVATSFSHPSLGSEFSSLDNINRSTTPQQRGSAPAKNAHDGESLLQQFQRAPNTSQHQSTLSNPFQGHNPVLSGHPRHGRQSSRYTFANDSISATATVKSSANAQALSQQSAMLPSQNKSYPTQTNMQTGFYSGVQGPPPGLKSSGTPPISGGGMFAQGHGFGNAMGSNLNFTSQLPSKGSVENENVHLRGRSVTGGGLGPDTGKRESNISSDSYPYTSLASLNPLYGLQSVSSGSSERPASRQKRKGKKHRQANPSSGGGSGVVDLADPSILQARMHQNGTNQGPYGASQAQGAFNAQHMMYGGNFGAARW